MKNNPKLQNLLLVTQNSYLKTFLIENITAWG